MAFSSSGPSARRAGPRSAVLAVALLLVAGCGGDAVAPNLDRSDVAGSYLLEALAFDPDGSTPSVDVHAALVAAGGSPGVLTLLADGRMQFLWDDPESELVRLADGTFRTTPTGVELRFASGSRVGDLLLPLRVVVDRAGNGDLVLDAPGVRVPLDRLVAFAPELAGEPLVDPVPGRLTGRFSHEGGAS